jgi:hypothetical protein
LEHGLFYIGLATAALSATLVWVYYMALEPFIRREWPTLLISWTRLLDGRPRDPRAGRDLLIGVLAATLGLAFAMMSLWLGVPMRPTQFTATALLGSSELIGAVLDAHLVSLTFCLLAVIILVLIRRFLRSRSLAASGLILLLTAIFSLAEGVPPVGWLVMGVFFGSGVGVLVRYGFVAYLAWATTVTVLRLPITTNGSAFYFENGLFAVGVVAGIAIYGCYTATQKTLVFG